MRSPQRNLQSFRIDLGGKKLKTRLKSEPLGREVKRLKPKDVNGGQRRMQILAKLLGMEIFRFIRSFLLNLGWILTPG